MKTVMLVVVKKKTFVRNKLFVKVGKNVSKNYCNSTKSVCRNLASNLTRRQEMEKWQSSKNHIHIRRSLWNVHPTPLQSEGYIGWSPCSTWSFSENISIMYSLWLLSPNCNRRVIHQKGDIIKIMTLPQPYLIAKMAVTRALDGSERRCSLQLVA